MSSAPLDVVKQWFDAGMAAESEQRREYLCGPETFHRLLRQFGLVPGSQRVFEVRAGLLTITITKSDSVRDSGSFYTAGYPGSAQSPALGSGAR